MNIDTSVVGITIPQGAVKNIKRGTEMLWQDGGLPTAFQRCEYIACNSGNARIAMPNVKRTNKTKLVCDYRLHETGGMYGFLFAFTVVDGLRFEFYCGTNWLQSSPALNARYARIETASYLYPADFNRNIIEMDAKNGRIVYNGQTVASGSVQQIVSESYFTLFGRDNNFTCWADLYRCQVYDDDILKHDWIPCYLKSPWNGIPAGTIGIYDLLGSISVAGVGSGTPFYTNTGDGAFTKGADVI